MVKYLHHERDITKTKLVIIGTKNVIVRIQGHFLNFYNSISYDFLLNFGFLNFSCCAICKIKSTEKPRSNSLSINGLAGWQVLPSSQNKKRYKKNIEKISYISSFILINYLFPQIIKFDFAINVSV